jgi:hypothetical protein
MRTLTDFGLVQVIPTFDDDTTETRKSDGTPRRVHQSGKKLTSLSWVGALAAAGRFKVVT